MAHRAPVIIEKYNPGWPSIFRREQDALRAVLPQHFVIEHIGSTAVPGLAAKPIIDMMLGAHSLLEIDAVIPELKELGYEYLPQNEIDFPQRRFLAKPVVRPRHFHLHCVAMDDLFWNERLVFRDLLRADAELASDYAALKMELAKVFGDDRAGYTHAKSNFVRKAVQQGSC